MKSYDLGFRNGRCDRLLGIAPLDVAVYSSDKEYSKGYLAGYYFK